MSWALAIAAMGLSKDHARDSAVLPSGLCAEWQGREIGFSLLKNELACHAFFDGACDKWPDR